MTFRARNATFQTKFWWRASATAEPESGCLSPECKRGQMQGRSPADAVVAAWRSGREKVGTLHVLANMQTPAVAAQMLHPIFLMVRSHRSDESKAYSPPLPPANVHDSRSGTPSLQLQPSPALRCRSSQAPLATAQSQTSHDERVVNSKRCAAARLGRSNNLAARKRPVILACTPDRSLEVWPDRLRADIHDILTIQILARRYSNATLLLDKRTSGWRIVFVACPRSS